MIGSGVRYRTSRPRILGSSTGPRDTSFLKQGSFWSARVGKVEQRILYFWKDNGYPHDGRADKDSYRHDRHAYKDSYPHDSNNQCIILRLKLLFAMINVQLMLV